MARSKSKSKKSVINLNSLRYVLLGILAILLAVLFFKWQVMFDLPAQITAPSRAQVEMVAASYAPHLDASGLAAPQASAPQVPVSNGLISVKTDVLQVKINPQGGDLVEADLLQYSATQGASDPVKLFSQSPDQFYVAQSGLIGQNLSTENWTFKAPESSYVLGNQDNLKVTLKSQSQGIEILKTYTFHRGSYAVDVNYQVRNLSSTPWVGRFYAQLLRQPPVQKQGFLSSYTTFTGLAFSSPENHYQKFKFDAVQSSSVRLKSQAGWVAMVQHYFISAWVPSTDRPQEYFAQGLKDGVVAGGFGSPELQVAPESQTNVGATLYVGPAISQNLKAVSPYLDLTIDYGWLWFISEGMYTVMSFIHQFVGNWGIAIILVTILIKMLFYPLSAKSFASMARMRQLQPKVQQLREKLGDDRQKLGLATMELYRKEKVNPLSGCLPMIVQIPVFIALYWMLMESVELRQAPFFGWIHDLSARDPFFILPVLMGLSMFVQQRLNPPPADPTQAKVMMFLPVIFTVMFASFPAGLVLYWLANNLVSIVQQWYVMRRFTKLHPAV